MKDPTVYLRHIRDAVVRNLEIIGETVRQIPLAMRHSVPDVDWGEVIGMRN